MVKSHVHFVSVVNGPFWNLQISDNMQYNNVNQYHGRHLRIQPDYQTHVRQVSTFHVIIIDLIINSHNRC